MLRKLIKYDLKLFLKFMIPLWGVMVIAGLIQGIETTPDNLTSAKIIVLVFCFIFIENMILVIQRFYKSMYGREGYLTHTLPVTSNKLILSKVISATIISFTTAFILELENYILLYLQSKIYNGIYSINGIMIQQIKDFMQIKVLHSIIFTIIYGIFWVIHLIYQAYTAITLGQLSNKYKFLTMIVTGAIIFYVSYVIEMYFRTYNTAYTFWDLPTFILFIVEIIICHIIINYITRRKLNLE